jgi:hypothetical protein
MPRAVLAAALLVLCCACGGSGAPPPQAPPEPVSWRPAFNAPHHLVLALGRGEPPKTALIIAIDDSLRLRSIMGGTVVLMDAATGDQVAMIDAVPDGSAHLGQTVIAAGSMVTLHLADGRVAPATITETIDGKTERELLLALP